MPMKTRSQTASEKKNSQKIVGKCCEDSSTMHAGTIGKGTGGSSDGGSSRTDSEKKLQTSEDGQGNIGNNDVGGSGTDTEMQLKTTGDGQGTCGNNDGGGSGTDTEMQLKITGDGQETRSDNDGGGSETDTEIQFKTTGDGQGTSGNNNGGSSGTDTEMQLKITGDGQGTCGNNDGGGSGTDTEIQLKNTGDGQGTRSNNDGGGSGTDVPRQMPETSGDEQENTNEDSDNVNGSSIHGAYAAQPQTNENPQSDNSKLGDVTTPTGVTKSNQYHDDGTADESEHHYFSRLTQHDSVSNEHASDMSLDDTQLQPALKKPQHEKAWSVLYAFLILIIPILLGVYWMISQYEDLRPTDTSQKRQSERSVILAQEMNRLQKEYPTVPQSKWNVVAGASWTHTMDHQREPERPVVLLFVGRPGKGEIHNFATDVAEMYAKVFSERPVASTVIRIEGAKIEAMPSDDAKRNLHNQITSGFESSAKVLLITDFDKLPPCSAILFHAYCDSDNAPFRDVVIIFTVSLETDLPIDATFEDADYVIQNQLQTQWGNCPEEFPIDKMMAIHARVSNNIVFM